MLAMLGVRGKTVAETQAIESEIKAIIPNLDSASGGTRTPTRLGTAT